jgi:hypothetical protein
MDTETTLLFVTCFGIAAALCTIVVLMHWVRRRRIPPVAGGWAAACAAVVVLTLMAAPRDGAAVQAEYRTARYNTSGRRAAEQARVDELHRWIGPALEQYRSGRGVYPPTLEAAGIRTPMTRYGPLYYYSTGSRSDAWYLLSFGDIERHRFSADWDSRTKRWTVTSFSF